MAKNFKEHQQTNELVNLLSQKGEILSREEFYTDVLKTCGEMYDLLDKKISEEKDAYQKCKYKFEMYDLIRQIEASKNFHQDWKERKNTYQTQMAIITAECNQSFNFVFEEAKKLAQTQSRLAGVMKNYAEDKRLTDAADAERAQLKLDFYLFMKKELENHYEKYKNKPFVVPAPTISPENTQVLTQEELDAKNSASHLHKVE